MYKNHPNDILKTDGNVPFFRAIDIVTNANSVETYDIVVHIRLEDFVMYDCVIHPLSLKNIFDKLYSTSFCFVCNKFQMRLKNGTLTFSRSITIS